MRKILSFSAPPPTPKNTCLFLLKTETVIPTDVQSYRQKKQEKKRKRKTRKNTNGIFQQ